MPEESGSANLMLGSGRHSSRTTSSIIRMELRETLSKETNVLVSVVSGECLRLYKTYFYVCLFFLSRDTERMGDIFDWDGTITGRPQWTVVRDQPFYSSSQCEPRPHWGNMTVCPHRQLSLSRMAVYCIFFPKILIFPCRKSLSFPGSISSKLPLKSLSFPSSGQRFSKILIFPW